MKVAHIESFAVLPRIPLASPHPRIRVRRCEQESSKQRNNSEINIMEINITQLLETDMFKFSHSRMEGGENAGQETWRNALNGPRPLLKTPEEIQCFKEWVKESGGWTPEEIEAWNDNETQALFLQFIAGDVREAGADSLDETDWEQYQTDSESGRVSSNLHRSDDGQIYYSLNH